MEAVLLPRQLTIHLVMTLVIEEFVKSYQFKIRQSLKTNANHQGKTCKSFIDNYYMYISYKYYFLCIDEMNLFLKLFDISLGVQILLMISLLHVLAVEIFKKTYFKQILIILEISSQMDIQIMDFQSNGKLENHFQLQGKVED